MKYLFGPVPSRRLGQSLGIDIIPIKTCNWNCIYCQLGRTPGLAAERDQYVRFDQIEGELTAFFEKWGNKKLDWITFVGSGEPTLNTELGKMIRWIKANSDVPVAVITNGSLLHREDVREDLKFANAVMPSLDAGSESLFREVNRSKCDWEEYIQGLVDFKKEFTGKFWLEVMLLHEINTSYDQLKEIAELVKRINPDEVHLALPTRPPAEGQVKTAAQDEIFLAKTLIGKYARVLLPALGKFEISDKEHFEKSIYEIVSRHPLNQTQLQEILSDFDEEQRALAYQSLLDSTRVKQIQRYGKTFWVAEEAHFSQNQLG